MNVIKRDGKIVPFDSKKIVNAINKAMLSTYGNIYETDTAEEIARLIKEKNIDLTVEEIQDLVENYLMKSEYCEVAKEYILYRNQRTKERTKRGKILGAVMRRINASDVENSNANVDEKSFSGREKEAAADVQKIIALDYVLSPEVAEAHKTMRIYQHDLEKTNIGQHNCLQIDFQKLFTEGFRTRNGDVRPPASFSSACQQMAVIFQCQSQVQFGGAGSVHLDYDLAPFVKKSFRKHVKYYLTDVEEYSETNAEILLKCNEPIEMDNQKLLENNVLKKAYNFAIKQLEREAAQACEAMYHNLNTLESRAGS